MLKKHFLNAEITKNSFTLVSSTIVAQAIPLLLHPVLRRIYSPETFGAFAVYLNILSILVVITTFRYETAIVLPKSDIASANVLSLTFILNFLFCSFLLLQMRR